MAKIDLRDDRENTWVIVPAYNEAVLIGEVVLSLVLQRYRVVVIDDGSSDETAKIARAAGGVVLQHHLNLGQGGALQTGISFCLRNKAQFICTFDADGQHCVDDIARLCDRMMTHNVDVVLGSRFLGRSPGIARSRKVLLKLAVLFTRLQSGLSLTDAHNGLRLFRANAASKLCLRQLGMAHASEIVNRIAELKLTFTESPVTVLYTPYSKAKGQSGFSSLRILLDLLIGRMVH